MADQGCAGNPNKTLFDIGSKWGCDIDVIWGEKWDAVAHEKAKQTEEDRRLPHA